MVDIKRMRFGLIIPGILLVLFCTLVLVKFFQVLSDDMGMLEYDIQVEVDQGILVKKIAGYIGQKEDEIRFEREGNSLRFRIENVSSDKLNELSELIETEYEGTLRVKNIHWVGGLKVSINWYILVGVFGVLILVGLVLIKKGAGR